MPNIKYLSSITMKLSLSVDDQSLCINERIERQINYVFLIQYTGQCEYSIDEKTILWGAWVILSVGKGRGFGSANVYSMIIA